MQLPGEKLPFVSVIMPVRNEADFIRRSLGAVLGQSYPHDRLEIVVADGNSDDETVRIIERLGEKTDVSITVVNNPERIAPTALNRAVARAKGEIVVRVDGHCEIAADYVEKCVSYLVAGQADGVGGSIETVGETVTAQAIAAAMSSKFGVGGSAFRTVKNRELPVDTVAFPGYTRAILNRAGAFNEELVRNQDDEFNYRIRKLGGRILLAPDIRSRYYSRSDFRSLWRQYFQYGYWKVRVLQLHPKQMSPRQFVPLFFVVTLGALGLLSFFSLTALWALIVVLGVYLTANAAAAAQSAAGIGAKAAPLVSLGFVILHLSYGTGFLWGLFAFRSRWREAARVETAGSSF